MTSPEPISASHRSVYDTCDPDYLRQLREASGVEETWLARTACLSLAQVRQLEEGGENLFYSPTIKRQAYKRLLMILGAEPPSAIVDVADEPVPSVVHDLDEIIAMGEKNLNHRPWADFFQTARSRVSEHKISATVVLLMGLTAVASLVMPTASNEPMVVAERTPSKAPESLTLAALPAPVAQASAPVRAPASAAVSASAPAAAISTASATTMMATATTASSASAAAVVDASCQYTREALPQISPLSASKPSQYVYLVAAADVTVCVVDAKQQAHSVKLKAGESQSVFGAAPWQVSSPKLGKLQIYFQGWRVALPEGVDQRVALIEKTN